MPRKKSCPNSYPLSAEFEAPCILWLGHRGMCETMFPNVLGQNHTVLWDTSYPAIAAGVTQDMEEDYEGMRGKA